MKILNNIHVSCVLLSFKDQFLPDPTVFNSDKSLLKFLALLFIYELNKKYFEFILKQQ